MKDNNKEKDLAKNPLLKVLSTLKAKIVLGLILILIISILGYSAYKGKLPSTENMFTTYGPLPYDSVYVKGVSDTSSKKNIALDSLNMNDLDDTLINSSFNEKDVDDTENLKSNKNLDTSSSNEKTEVENLFHVNTSYDKIDIEPESGNEEGSATNDRNIDLFSELLLPNSKDKEAIERIFFYKTMSYKSLLKLLSIAGQKILLQNDEKTGQMMLDAIAESDNITEVFIINRKGNVIYSSLKKMKDVGEFSTIINYNIESNTIKVNEVNGRNSISIPIFYTHGKIGHVILNVKL